MTAAITPVSQATAALPVRPVAGERVMMDGGTAPLADIIQNLYDRTEHAKDATQTSISWSGDVYVRTGGTLTSFTIDIGAINSMVVNNGTALKALAAVAGTATQANIEGGGGTLGAVARSWYIYAYNNAGTLAYEISQTVPNSSRTTKNADASRRYLGCFQTTSAGAPIPVRAHRGRYVLTDRSMSSALHATQATAALGTYTSALSLAALIPPHARIVTVRLQIVRITSTATAQVQIRRSGGTDPLGQFAVIALPVLTPDERFVELDCGSGQTVEVATNGTDTTVSVDVAGWQE